jgi:uroporphyrinogen decarboxylase
MAQAYIRLREILGLPPSEVFVYDFIQQLAVIEDDVLDILGVDVVDVGQPYYRQEDYWQDWTLPDGSPCKIPAFIEVEKDGDDWIVRGDEDQVIMIQKKGTLFFEQTHFPLMESGDDTFENLEYQCNQVMWARIGSPPAPAGLDREGLQIREETARRLREGTDRAIYGAFGGNLVENGEFLFRIDNFLLLLAADPDRVHRFLDRLMELHLANLEKYLSAAGPYIDIIGFGDDMGMQTGPLFSPEMYREFFKPRHRILWNRAKELRPGIKVGLHCCGGVYPLIGDMIEAGLDAINPVQFTCTDMEVDRLKREFGGDLVFWGGGCDTQTILRTGSPQRVAEHVKRQVEVLAPGGGFVFQQVHNILADIPAANIVAMFEAVNP